MNEIASRMVRNQPSFPAFAVSLAVLLPALVDQNLPLVSSLPAHLVNTALPFAAFLLVWALTGRPWVALAIELALLASVRYVSGLKQLYLGTDLLYQDFSMVGSVIENPELMLAYVPKPAMGVALLMVLLVASALWLIRKRPKTAWPVRVTAGVLAMAGLLGVTQARAPDAIPMLDWEVFGQMHGAARVGTLGNLLLGHMTARSVSATPDTAMADGFWKSPHVVDAKAKLAIMQGGERPDIIIIQSESLFDPAKLQDLSSDEYLKDIVAAPPGQAGELQVPVFGGRTLQTEFEVISGGPISFYKGSTYIYYEAVNESINALPRYLGRQGYRTVAMHPSKRGFWRRGRVMPLLGFDTFVDEDAFVRPDDYSSRQHVSDMALMQAMVSELDSATAPTMVMGITMDNHGPWGDYQDLHIPLPQDLSEKARAEISDYVSRAKDASTAFAYLVDALKQRERPTLVVLYGDHLPTLPAAYAEMKFADGSRPEQQSPPVRVWANYPTPAFPAKLPAYLLPGWILRAANQPLSGHFLANALLGQIQNDPTVGDAEKALLVQQYGHVAAVSLNRKDPASQPEPVTLTGSSLAELLGDRLDGRTRPVADPAQGFEAGLGMGWGSTPAMLSTRGMQTVTFRAYLDRVNSECRSEARLGGYVLDVQADGKTVYRAGMAASAMRMVTLDTHGVGQLKFTATAPSASPKCQELAIRIPQIQCASLACDVDTAAGKTKNVYASRILQNDYVVQDRLAKLKAFTWDGPVNNMTGMLRRILAEQTGISKFEVRDNIRLFMHPVASRSTWAEFDVSGLKQITLKPAIDPLVGECLTLNTPGEEAGVVGFSVTLDGVPVLARSVIDRNYKNVIPVKLRNGKRLRLTIDQGNRVDWCDWFTVGFPQVTPAE